MKVLKVLSIAVMLWLAGCDTAGPPQSQKSSTNPAFSVETLFYHDGCSVNRFRDQGRYIYFVTCNRRGQTIWWYQESCGKNCWYDIWYSIDTEGEVEL